MKRHRILALFVLLTALQVLPVWSVKYLPLGDGPTHIYNAWVLHGLVTDRAPPDIEAAYRIDWAPYPNWTGHVLMALFIAVVPPLVAEKLLVTLIIALLAAGAWHLTTAVDERNDVYAFLVFPFTYTQTLIAGYYNYSLSVGLFLIILAVWWRRRDARRISTLVLEAALLVLCYFTHPQATLLACAAIGFLSLFTKRFFHLPALIPALSLLALFGRSEQSGGGEPNQHGITWVAARILARVETMHSLGGGQLVLSTIVALIFAALIILTVGRASRPPRSGILPDRTGALVIREANLLAILALLFAAMMFWLPAPAGTRALFTQRNPLFVFLTLAAWFTPHVPRKILLAILTAVAIANAAINFDWLRRLGGELHAYVRTFDMLDTETTILPLYFTPAPSPSIVDAYVHAISYVALEKRSVDRANYEPGTRYFPIALRDVAIDPYEVEYAPGAVDLTRHVSRAEYIVARGMPEDTPQRRDLEQHYRLVKETGDLRVYRRKAPLVDHELLLLPLLGTLNDVGAPNGAWWRIEQRITNRGSAPVRAVFRNCPAEMPCELTIAKSMRIATSDKFAFLHVPRGAKLDATTTVRRVDVDRPDLSVNLPAPREHEFQRGTVRIENVRTSKIGLRLYLISERPWSDVVLRLRSRETDKVIEHRTLEVAGFGMFENADLSTDFPGFASKASAVDIEIDAPPDARVWAFATETSDAGQARVITSRSSAPARGTAPLSHPPMR